MNKIYVIISLPLVMHKYNTIQYNKSFVSYDTLSSIENICFKNNILDTVNNTNLVQQILHHILLNNMSLYFTCIHICVHLHILLLLFYIFKTIIYNKKYIK